MPTTPFTTKIANRIRAFRYRNVTIETPVIVTGYDEFDADFDHESLGWVRHACSDNFGEDTLLEAAAAGKYIFVEFEDSLPTLPEGLATFKTLELVPASNIRFLTSDDYARFGFCEEHSK